MFKIEIKEVHSKFSEIIKKDSTEVSTSDIAMAFVEIERYKKKDEELDNLFNQLIEKNKELYMIWCMCNHSYMDFLKFLKSRAEGENTFRYKFLCIKYSEDDIKAFSAIINDLINRQKKDGISYVDIDYLRAGGTSIVNQVGDYIVKCGSKRFTKAIPNHRRILQPIIRMQMEEGGAFFEVADVVDVTKGTKEDVDQIFNEMLEDGKAWTDPKTDNIGALKRTNYPRHNIEIKTKNENGIQYVRDQSSSSEVSTNISGNYDGEALGPGEIVITDTDMIYDLRKIKSIDELRYNTNCIPHEYILRIMEKFEEIQEEKKKEDEKEI